MSVLEMAPPAAIVCCLKIPSGGPCCAGRSAVFPGSASSYPARLQSEFHPRCTKCAWRRWQGGLPTRRGRCFQIRVPRILSPTSAAEVPNARHATGIRDCIRYIRSLVKHRVWHVSRNKRLGEWATTANRERPSLWRHRTNTCKTLRRMSSLCRHRSQ